MSKLPNPNSHRLSDLHTLEVTARDGNVWIEVHHGITVSVTALFPGQARTIAAALSVAADKAGGKPPKPKCSHRMGFGVDGLYRCQKCRKLPASIRKERTREH